MLGPLRSVTLKPLEAKVQSGPILAPGLSRRSCCGAAISRGILKKCVNSQAVYPLSEQHGLKARERRYTAYEEGKHWE